MKIHIGPYINWIGPYQIAEKLLFWLNKYEDDRVHKLGQFFAHGFHKPTSNIFSLEYEREHKTWLYKLCEWIHSKRERKVKIHIDPYDTWSMDSTLSMIMLPMLKQLKEQKQGTPWVDKDDVPTELHVEDSEYPVEAYYSWVINELIWTFEQLQPDYDWEDQYTEGEIDFVSVPYFKNGKKIGYTLEHGPEHTYEVNMDARAKHQARIDNGLRLLGKYWKTLWT